MRSVGSEEQSLLRSGLKAGREEFSGTRAFLRGRRFSRAVTCHGQSYKMVAFLKITFNFSQVRKKEKNILKVLSADFLHLPMFIGWYS